ncbi:hypothetical protein C1I97_34570 [Streptomyces sp. NTH33]|nr:hypothetical protein C1I97_34570 [Streptomyces sp. NTH33]
MRKPVSSGGSENSESEAEDTAGAVTGGEAQQQPAPAPAAKAPAEPAAGPAAPAGEKPTSDWFAPRKPQANKGGQGGGSTNGAGPAGGSPAAGGPGTGSSGTGAGSPGAGSSGARPGGAAGSVGVPGAANGSRPGGAPGPGSAQGTGLPGVTGGPVAPGHGGGTGSFDVTEALAAGPRPGGPRPGSGGGEPRRDDLPYFSENGGGQNGQAGQAGQGGYGGQGGPSGPSGFNGAGGPGGSGGPGGPQGPAGPTGGPVTGDGPLRPNAGGAPGAPTAHPGGGLSDDTAVLTPQKPAPKPGTPGYGARPGNVSGHTVTSGMPVIAPSGGEPFGPAAGGGGPMAHTPPGMPGPAPKSAAPSGAGASKAAKKKGRGKLPLLVGGVVLVAGVAYGAGLLMNRSDVPKGTTVLGVDIGGGTRDDAVKKLDDVFGKRVNQPLKLSVEGRTITLKPDQAGLQFDTQATASAAATSDYNPVSVIGSLFGNHREVEPRMPVDEEKLQVALQNTSGGVGSVTEGGIKFESGKAVAVYGKPGKGIDVARSAGAVQEAYRTQVETGSALPVRLPTTTRQPTISNAEVDRMMKEFAEPAMSGNVTVMTDPAHSVPFSPQNSLWKFLRVKAVNGKLVDNPDLKALKELYGQTFDGVLITRGTGKKTAVTPQDVYVALRQALLSKTDRVGVIDTDPS